MTTDLTSLQLSFCVSTSLPASAKRCSECAFISLHKKPAVQTLRHQLCDILFFAGLHTVGLQRLGPDTVPSALKALATLRGLRSLNMP
jgi:hypothetical protein